MQRTTVGIVATTLLILAATGCGTDGPSAPARTPSAPMASRHPAPTMRGRPLASILDTVDVLRRIVPLRAGITQTAVIGPAGGDIRIGAAGVAVHFPAGAVAVPTTISMTARAGWEIAYDFEPHGIQFAQPVTIRQDLGKTVAAFAPSLLASLEGSYYDETGGVVFLDPADLVAAVKEHLGGSCDRKSMVLTFDIHHFSGYLVSSGRKPNAR